jgi:hypothetical protein
MAVSAGQSSSAMPGLVNRASPIWRRSFTTRRPKTSNTSMFVLTDPQSAAKQNSVRFSVIAAMVMVTSIMRAMIIVAMVIGFFRRGNAGRDGGGPDIAGNTAAHIIFGFCPSREEDRCPNRDEGCGGNDERLLHIASPESTDAVPIS